MERFSQKIMDLRGEADDLESTWLRSRGWKHHSNTPGSYWMWERAWNGRVMLVDKKTAARIQEMWDELHERVTKNESHRDL